MLFGVTVVLIDVNAAQSKYLKGQLKLGLWYPKDSPFDLVAYTDNDYARASLDRKSTIKEAEYVAASSCYRHVRIGFKSTTVIMDEVVYKELGNSLVRAATTASSLEVE
ncbi:hypothetical protein Tco_1363112 [Tanacetum coccineum]